MDRVFIANHHFKNIYLIQKYFIKLANSSQFEFMFSEVDISYGDRKTIYNQDLKIHVNDMAKDVYHLKKKYKIDENSLFVVFCDCQLFDEEDDDFYFVMYDLDDENTPGIAVISTHFLNNIHKGSSDLQIDVAEYVTINLLSLISCYYCDVDTHMDTTGCILDYCDEMEDIKHSIKNGFVFCETKGCLDKMMSTNKGKAILKLSTLINETGFTKIATELKQLSENEITNMQKLMLVNPIWETRKFVPDPKSCFVLMPFHEEFSPYIWEILQEIIIECNLTPSRADNYYGNIIMEDIWQNINQARIVLVEMTKQNPNVFYELGVAHSIGKDVILLAQTKKQIPFDISSNRVLIYSNNKPGYDKLKRDLPKYIEHLLKK